MPETVKRVAKLSQNTFMFVCMDGPETKPLRTQHLFGHLDYIEANNEKYRVAGPMKDTPDGEIVGSFFLIAADTETAAWDIMKGDPYIASEMYAHVTVHHVDPACGNWIGGIIWDQEEIRENMKKYT